jgi:hypothetical protein
MQYPKISYVQALTNYQLFLIFDNGVSKVYDSKQLLQNSPFEILKDEQVFMTVKKGSGGYGVIWNDALDLSEATLWENSFALATVQNLVENSTKKFS